MDRHITFRADDGTTIKYTVGTDLWISSISGIASIESEHTVVETPFIPGAITRSIHDRQRFIEMDIRIPNARRAFFLNFFRVNSTGRFTCRFGEDERFIDYIVSASRPYQRNYRSPILMHLTLRCAYPYFKDTFGFGENLGEVIPLLWHGRTIIKDPPSIVAAYVKAARQHAITNTGEVSVGFYMIIKTTESATNPRLIFNDLFIRIGTDNNPIILERNDILEISTIVESGNLPDTGRDVFVRLNGINILNRIDQHSTLFQIPPGRHEISYDADDGAGTLQLWFWRNWAWTWA